MAPGSSQCAGVRTALLCGTSIHGHMRFTTVPLRAQTHTVPTRLVRRTGQAWVNVARWTTARSGEDVSQISQLAPGLYPSLADQFAEFVEAHAAQTNPRA